MNADAVATMIVCLTLVWGGLLVSILKLQKEEIKKHLEKQPND